jgi:hypothetical protein
MSTLKVDTISEKTASGGITFSDDITATLSSSSNVKAPLNASGDAPVYACRAWVNFDGTFGTSPFTVANGGIRASGNVSSVTDNGGNGDYTVNFTTAMPDANYVTATQSQLISHNADASTARTTTAFRFQVRNSLFNFADYSVVEVCVFR